MIDIFLNNTLKVGVCLQKSDNAKLSTWKQERYTELVKFAKL